jgi:hypothetical protein
MAECLGLDASKFKSQQRADEDDMDMFWGGNFALDDEERFKDCKPLTLTTKNGVQFDFCGIRDVMEGKVDVGEALAPSTPGKENAPVNVGKAALVEQIQTPALVNQVQLAVRERIKEYYAAPLRSDDDINANVTRNITLRVGHDALVGTMSANSMSTGTMERSVKEEDLYTQLLYYKRLLSIDDALRAEADREKRGEMQKKIKGTDLEKSVREANRALDKIMDKCSYKWISLSDLFGVAKV